MTLILTSMTLSMPPRVEGLGGQMASRALQGDGALSGIGAATSLLALAALALNDMLGWWWPDRIAALIVAAVAAAEAWHTAPWARQGR